MLDYTKREGKCVGWYLVRGCSVSSPIKCVKYCTLCLRTEAAALINKLDVNYLKTIVPRHPNDIFAQLKGNSPTCYKIQLAGNRKELAFCFRGPTTDQIQSITNCDTWIISAYSLYCMATRCLACSNSHGILFKLLDVFSFAILSLSIRSSAQFWVLQKRFIVTFWGVLVHKPQVVILCRNKLGNRGNNFTFLLFAP